MKKILVLGVCALFIACNSSTEKTSETDSSTALIADTNEVVSAADTAVAVNVNPAPAAATNIPESKPAEVKKAEPVAAKVSQPAVTVKPAETNDNAEIKKGEMLISKSDCFACHKLQEKLLGPSYKEVANKYEKTRANIDYLAGKIKNGGSGVWGAIPMAPHPALSDDDVKAMVHYVLSIK